jgi:hypothetical protein
MPKAQRTPAPSGAFESPVKTSINADDGVIDVDVPLPDFITSFESAVSSPSSSGYLSASGFGTGLDAFEQSFRFAADGDAPLNVAGWLQQYHRDFVLQALPVKHGILEDIKESMRAEPNPPIAPETTSSSENLPTEKWIDITSAIVADTTTFTITRIRYRRLVKLKQHSGGAAERANLTPAAASTSAAAPTTPSTPSPIQPPTVEAQLKEEFIEEPVVAFDDVLVEAVERVIAAAGTDSTVSKVSSTSSSRSTSKRRERERRDSLSAPPAQESSSGRPSTEVRVPGPGQGHDQSLGAGVGHGHGQGQGLMPIGAQEVPRVQCKTVLLTALEEIIQDVITEREEMEVDGGRGPLASLSHGHGDRDRDRESLLREAVRGWIEGLDLATAD